jgi:hypothetical protein
LYQLSDIIELDDALIGGRHKGKRGHGANGKTSELIACESGEKKAGFIAMEAVSSVCHSSVDEFSYQFKRRFIEQQIPNQLLNLAIIHAL